jgi:hypothetical protein
VKRTNSVGEQRIKKSELDVAGMRLNSGRGIHIIGVTAYSTRIGVLLSERTVGRR